MLHFVKAKEVSCEIITMPPQMINKIKDFGASSNKLSIKTVEGFIKDTRKQNLNFEFFKNYISVKSKIININFGGLGRSFTIFNIT